MCDCSIIFHEKNGTSRSDNLLRPKAVIPTGEFWPNAKLLDFRSKGALFPDEETLLADQSATSGVLTEMR